MKLLDEDREMMRSYLKSYINDHCIIRAKPEDKILIHSSSTKENIVWSEWQFYLRRGLFNSEFLTKCGLLFWDIFYDEYKQNPFQVTGLETAATPLIVGISMAAPVFGIENFNCFSIRKELKPYGLMNRFEGIVDPLLPVLIVDDICNTRGTIAKAIKFLKKENVEIYPKAFSIVNVDAECRNKSQENLFFLHDFNLSWNSYNLSKHYNIKPVDI